MPETESIQIVSGLVNQVPWMQTVFYNNTVGEYLTVIGLVLLTYILTRGITWLLEHHARRFAKSTSNKIDDQIVELIHRSITFICVLTVFYLGILSLEFPGIVDMVSGKTLFVLFTLKITREADRFAVFLIESYLEAYARKQKGLVKTFLAPMARISKFIIWTLSLLLIAGNLGYNITSLLAGLGVGGLAVALAAQETLSNTFGSLSILSGQPLKVGEWVVIDGIEGEVVEIGLRSTRIQTIDLRLVSIPNKITSNVTIENYSRRNAFNVELVIRLSYNTSAADIKDLTKAIHRILRKDTDVRNEDFRVNVTDFGEYSIELTVFYYITDVSTYERSISIRERVNMKIKEAIDKAGIEIPYPTQSIRIQNANAFLPAQGRQKTHR